MQSKCKSHATLKLDDLTSLLLVVNNVKFWVGCKLQEKHDDIDGKEDNGKDVIWAFPLLREPDC